MCAVQSHGLHFNWPPLQYLGPFAFSNKFYKLGGRQNGLEKDTPPHLLLHDQVGLGAWLASRSGSGAAWLESLSLARRSGSGSAWLAVISLFLRDLLGPYLALIAPHLLPASCFVFHISYFCTCISISVQTKPNLLPAYL